MPQPQGQAAGGVAVAGAAAGLPANLPMIDRPHGTRWSIRESMQLAHAEYAEIQVSTLNSVSSNRTLTYMHRGSQRTIRSLVIRAQLDWTEDFRRQDANRLATLFRAVRTFIFGSAPMLREVDRPGLPIRSCGSTRTIGRPLQLPGSTCQTSVSTHTSRDISRSEAQSTRRTIPEQVASIKMMMKEARVQVPRRKARAGSSTAKAVCVYLGIPPLLLFALCSFL